MLSRRPGRFSSGARLLRFQCRRQHQNLSRGGSDITGSLVARAIHADMYENWTDVSGFLVADPRIIEDPEVIETIRRCAWCARSACAQRLVSATSLSACRQRPLLNRTFLVMAMTAGLSLPIINPLDKALMAAIDAFNVLCDHDRDASLYIARHAQEQTVLSTDASLPLQEIILHGLKDEVEGAIRSLLTQNAADGDHQRHP